MKLTKERLAVVISAAGFLAALGLYIFVYGPLIKKLKTTGRECRVAEEEVLDTHSAIDSTKGREIKKCPSSDAECSMAIDELTGLGKSKGINFISKTPKEKEPSEYAQYQILPIEIEAESTFAGLGSFLGSLRELRESIVTLRSFHIIAGNVNPHTLKANLVLNMYIKKSQEDEK